MTNIEKMAREVSKAKTFGLRCYLKKVRVEEEMAKLKGKMVEEMSKAGLVSEFERKQVICCITDAVKKAEEVLTYGLLSDIEKTLYNNARFELTCANKYGGDEQW